MTRELKFRAWDNVGKRMLQDVAPGTVTYFDGDIRADYNDCTLMQFTGLHDKNGKEIYEGDIIEFHRTEQDKAFYQDRILEVVMFVHGQFLPRPLDGEDATVVGNVHQNPELLTESNA